MFLLGGPEDRPLTPREQRWADRLMAVVLVLSAVAIVGALGGR